MIALRHLREQVAVIVPDVRLLVGPRSCTCTSPFASRQSHHVSSPYFKQLILGLWFGFCFTFHELLGLQLHVQLGLQLRVPLQLRRLLRWSSIGAREGFCLLCLLSLEPWINKNFFKGQGQQVVWRVACVVRRCGLWWLVVVVCGAAWRRPRPARGKASAATSPAGCYPRPPR